MHKKPTFSKNILYTVKKNLIYSTAGGSIIFLTTVHTYLTMMLEATLIFFKLETSHPYNSIGRRQDSAISSVSFNGV